MLCAFKNFITDRTSQSDGAGKRVSIFNRCNDATVRTLEVPLVHYHAHHYSITYKQSLHATDGLVLWYKWETYFVDAPRSSREKDPS